jgi:TolB-like protein
MVKFLHKSIGTCEGATMDRGQQISRIFHEALGRDSRERAAFLAEACAGDAELYREVESLLGDDDATKTLGEVAALEMMAAISTTPPTPLVAGERLAHYRIVQKIGAGGMGEVYRARDERLDRDVAIKVLPATSFEDPAARARLVREARAAAGLNHPHICTVHEVGEANGKTYIAMELVEGEPLSAQVTAGALRVEHVVRYGAQLAGALAHAHERGVVHRDLKSANVIVTPDGRVKVLDFGLAKRVTATELAITQSQGSLTQVGTVMGTLAYMAPELLRGHMAQMSSDIWALGIVLYEMSAGTRPFQGQTGFELSAAILSRDPAPLGAHIPAALQAVIGCCLEKDAGRRYQTGSEVHGALERLQTDFRAPPFRLTRRHAIRLGVAAAIGAASGLAAWGLWPSGAPVRSLAVLPFQNVANEEAIDYLCDGVTESLIHQVSNIRALKVIARSTIFNFTGKPVDPRAAGRQLGVDSVLKGTLSRKAGRLVITAELLDVASGEVLWKNDYNRGASDLLSVQDEIARAIMDDGLRLRLSSNERRQLVRTPTTDGEAYDLYLQARHLQRRATEQDYLTARQLLRTAIVRDQQFALAHVALGATYAMMAADGLERPTTAWPAASRHTSQALELDPSLTEAHVLAHAKAFLFDWDWAGAERERKLVMRSLPGDFDPQFLRAFAMERWALGRPDEALQLARTTRELDPLSPNLNMLEADYLVHAGQLDASVNLYEKAIRSDPSDPNPLFGLAEVRYRQGRFDEAIEIRRQAHAAAGDDALKEVLASARGEEGYRQIDRMWVRVQLSALKERATAEYVSPLDFARVYAQLDDAEEAFRYLAAAFEDRSPGLVYLKVDRAWDSLRKDPRFGAAVDRVDLP